MRLLLASALVIVMATLGACGTKEGDSQLDFGMSAKLVTIDGVRCIVLNGYNGDAISCDWSSP